MKYLAKWTKEGNMRFISHLDIMRLFQRALKRKNIKLRYSEGFSPHPKMSIVQPLSLGYTSIGEYIEFETSEDISCDEIKLRLSEAMPPGMEIISCTELKETKKTAAIITLGAYTLGFGKKGLGDLKEAVEWFDDMPEVLVEKKQKKSGKVTSVDIRSKVKGIAVETETEDYFLVKVFCDTGSESNLNPGLIADKLCEHMGILRENIEVHVRRDEMFTESVQGTVIPLYLLR